ncbi:winged helix-turn-helix domain-containing protein [Vibrio harveyi]|nr:winged helix-turn-helix domain-containing protein [Vibrio harveyi]
MSGKTEELDALKLTNKQKALLNCLVDAYPNTISNKEIIQQVWGYEHISQESLPQLINRTRRTLEDNEKTILVNTPRLVIPSVLNLLQKSQFHSQLPSQKSAISNPSASKTKNYGKRFL